MWSALSLAWGAASGVGSLSTWAGAAGVLIAATRLDATSARRAAAVAGAGIGGGSALIALAQAASGGRGFAVHGGHGNPNWLGLVLAIALPLSIDLAAWLRRERARAWPAAAALAALEAPALYLSHSRVAWAAAAVTAIAWAALSLRPTSSARRARRAAIGAVASLALLAAGLTVAWRSPPLETSAPAPLAEEERGPSDVPIAAAWEGRTWIWKTSAAAARRALPIGAGLGRFARAYLDAQGERLAALEPRAASRHFANATTAHNDWIQAAVEGGAIGAALLAAAIAAGIAAALRAGWYAGAASLCAFAIAALGDSPIQLPAAAVLIALVLAAARGEIGERATLPRGERDRDLRRHAVARTLALASCGLLLAAATRAWLAQRRVTAARDAVPEARLTLLERAARIDPWSGEAWLSLGLSRLEVGDASRALAALERSRPLLANVGTDVALGNAHLALGAPGRAAAAYARALSQNPGSFRAHANVVEALVRLGRLDEAATHLAIARSLWPGHPKILAIAERLRRARIDAGVSTE